MGEVLYRGGLLKFSIPDQWTQDLTQEIAEYFDADFGAGTTRVNVITAERKDRIATPEVLKHLIRGMGPKTATKQFYYLPQDLPVTSYTTEELDDDVPIVRYTFIIGFVADLHKIHTAVITYTTHYDRLSTPAVKTDLDGVALILETVEFGDP